MTAEVVYDVSSKQSQILPESITRVVSGYVVGCDKNAGDIMRSRFGLTGATDDVVLDPLQILIGLYPTVGVERQWDCDLGPQAHDHKVREEYES